MRLTDEIKVDKSTTLPDGYGGTVKVPVPLVTVAAIVSIKNDELKSKPSGLGYYRSATIIVEKNKIDIKDKVIYDDATYTITRQVNYQHSFLEIFIGYEV